MRIANYKKILFSNDIPAFINMLQEMKCDNNTYSEIKRLNNLLKERINDLGDEVIERDNYRIIPYKHSLTYFFSLSLQSKVDFAEYMVKMMKYNKCYSSFKKERKSYDCVIEDVLFTQILNSLISLLSDYNLIPVMETSGFGDIHEIEYIIEKSNINTALKNLDKIIDREEKFKENNINKKDSNVISFTKHSDNSMEESFKFRQDFVNSTNHLNKINIIHVPLLHNRFPSIYLSDSNTILVSRLIHHDDEGDCDSYERVFLSEFGMYVHYKITNDIMKVPESFANEHPSLNGAPLNRLYYDLFASRMLQDTEIEHKDALIEDLKDNPFGLLRFKRDIKYFDILIEEEQDD